MPARGGVIASAKLEFTERGRKEWIVREAIGAIDRADFLEAPLRPFVLRDGYRPIEGDDCLLYTSPSPRD